jgi:hypothetical protein
MLSENTKICMGQTTHCNWSGGQLKRKALDCRASLAMTGEMIRYIRFAQYDKKKGTE